MTDEEMADASWRSKDLWYKVNADEKAYKDGFKDAIKHLIPVAKYLIPADMKEFMENFDVSEFEERLSKALKED